jgi:hypothetical protein
MANLATDKGTMSRRRIVEKKTERREGEREREKREGTTIREREEKQGDKAMQSVRCNNVNTDGAADKKI